MSSSSSSNNNNTILSSSSSSTTTVFCFICHTNLKKYTCPRCSIHYCSLPCYNQHKSHCVSNNSVSSLTNNLKNNQTTVLSSSSSMTLSTMNTTIHSPISRTELQLSSLSNDDNYDDDNTHKIPLERLELLYTNPELRNILKDSRIQSILSNINHTQPSSDRAKHLQIYLQKEGKNLQSILDTILITIGVGKRDPHDNQQFIFTGLPMNNTIDQQHNPLINDVKIVENIQELVVHEK